MVDLLFLTLTLGVKQGDRSDWSDEVFANTMICLINQASYLLWKQMQLLEDDFIKEGGFTEKLYLARAQTHKN